MLLSEMFEQTRAIVFAHCIQRAAPMRPRSICLHRVFVGCKEGGNGRANGALVVADKWGRWQTRRRRIGSKELRERLAGGQAMERPSAPWADSKGARCRSESDQQN